MRTFSGYPLLGSFDFPKRPATRKGTVFLMDRGESMLRDRYVVATVYDGDMEWTNGMYFDNNEYELAVKEFAARLVREA